MAEKNPLEILEAPSCFNWAARSDDCVHLALDALVVRDLWESDDVQWNE